MPRKNRYTGILQPRSVGRGAPEVWVLVLYDIEDDKLRDRIAQLCQDYGLNRIQYSAFAGKLNRNHRQELLLEMQAQVGGEAARILAVPVCAEDFREVWRLEQFVKDLSTEKKPPMPAMSNPTPKLRIIGADEDE
jgi:CRISPR-associated protein Cas2